MTNLAKVTIAVLAALGIGSAALYAREASPPGDLLYAAGPGMMGEYGPGAGGYGPYGRGMMGRGGGPGMMGGQGMMGGPGGGMMGMMGGPALADLDLTDAQRKQVLAIQDEVRKKNWTAMGVMHDEMAKMRDALWAGSQRDRAAIAAANRRMADLRQQMLDNMLDAADRIEKILTPQQREALQKRWGPGWMVDPEE
jgi:Spy/CpxP family protein refolding chaperone